MTAVRFSSEAVHTNLDTSRSSKQQHVLVRFLTAVDPSSFSPVLFLLNPQMSAGNNDQT